MDDSDGIVNACGKNAADGETGKRIERSAIGKETEAEWNHVVDSYLRLWELVESATTNEERRFALNCLLRYFDFLLDFPDRRYDHQVFNLIDELLGNSLVKDAIWLWVRHHLISADDARRSVLDVCLFEYHVEDSPLEWDERTLKMFELWFDEKTQWVLELAYSYFPKRLPRDLAKFGRNCVERCTIAPAPIEEGSANPDA